MAIDISPIALKVLKLNKSGGDFKVVDYCIVDFEKKVDPVTLGSEGLEQFKVALQTAVRKLKLEKHKATLILSDTIVDKTTASVSKDILGSEVQKAIENKLGKSGSKNLKNIFYDFVYSEELTNENSNGFNVFSVQSTFLQPKADVLKEVGLIPSVGLTTRDAIDSLFDQIDMLGNKPSIIFDVSEGGHCIYLKDENGVFYSKEDRFSVDNLLASVKSYFKCQTENARNILKKGGLEEAATQELIIPFVNQLYKNIDTVVKFSNNLTLEDYENIFIVGDLNYYPEVINHLSKISEKIKTLKLKSNIHVAPEIQDKFAVDKYNLYKVLGAGFSQGGKLPNLLPWRDAKAAENIKSYKSAAILSVMVGMLFSLGAYTYYSQDLTKQSAYNSEIQSDIDVIAVNFTKLKTVSEKKDRLNKRIELIHSLQEQRPVLTLALNALVQSTPDSIFLEGIKKRANKFTFEGRAASADDVADFMRTVKSSMWFDQVFMVSYKEYEPPKDGLVPDVNSPENSMNKILDVAPEQRKVQTIGEAPKTLEDTYGTFVVTAEFLPSNISKNGLGDAQVRVVELEQSNVRDIKLSDGIDNSDEPKVLGVVKGRNLPLDSGVNPESAKKDLTPEQVMQMKLRSFQRGSR